ncbi:MAG: indigoidine synthase A family protein [Acidobacteria bacterium OLB17]|nr:MAG: indigoidine synthase A family protein [Acidobacteria bacterium OLB17]MCZ2390202.1 pseudouridine-5'-phosphate glycosidase [Acidobacteriota bacterium]
MDIKFTNPVKAAREKRGPIVALESTVISHGLPFPQNLETAAAVEEIVESVGATPATIAVLDGVICCGVSRDELNRLATEDGIRKISRRDIAVAAAKRLTAATTVATTTLIAHAAAIDVFATGGIGGVHRGYSADVSADLPELANTPITVVCSGPKMILDVAATREWLETYGITVLGWKCDEMPGFYSRTSGLAVDERVDSAEEAAAIIRGRDKLGLKGAVLVTAPVPAEYEIELEEVESFLNEALHEAASLNVSGKETTPFLLSSLVEKSGGRTLAANIALLKNNAKVAAEIAVALKAI